MSKDADRYRVEWPRLPVERSAWLSRCAKCGLTASIFFGHASEEHPEMRAIPLDVAFAAAARCPDGWCQCGRVVDPSKAEPERAEVPLPIGMADPNRAESA